jgi:hypothetical protein
MKKGKVQTNDYGVNVLVEHEDCTTKHYSHLDKDVLCEKMTDEEVNQEFDKLVLTKADKISFLKKIEGFAVSNVSNHNMLNFRKKTHIDSGDLFRYTSK